MSLGHDSIILMQCMIAVGNTVCNTVFVVVGNRNQFIDNRPFTVGLTLKSNIFNYTF